MMSLINLQITGDQIPNLGHSDIADGIGGQSKMSLSQREATEATRSGWRSFPFAAAGWKRLASTAPATASADSVWPLRAAMER